MTKDWKITIQERLISKYVSQHSSEWIELNFSSSNLLNLTIVSHCFCNITLSQRKQELLKFLQAFYQEFNISLSTGFLSLYTPEEADSLELHSPQKLNHDIFTWQDLANVAANPQNQNKTERKEPSLPRTIVFYSFKG